MYFTKALVWDKIKLKGIKQEKESTGKYLRSLILPESFLCLAESESSGVDSHFQSMNHQDINDNIDLSKRQMSSNEPFIPPNQVDKTSLHDQFQ